MKKIFFFFMLFSFFSFSALAQKPQELKKATLYVFPKYTQNKAFSSSSSRYNIGHFDPLLKEAFRERGYDLATQDIHPPEISEIVLVIWTRAPLPAESEAHKTFYWMNESPLSMDMPLKNGKEKYYNKIFTYNRQIVDGDKYIYLQTPYLFRSWVEVETFIPHKNQLVIQVATNYASTYPFNDSLYPEREKIVHWFLENHPDDLTVYGEKTGWMKFKEKLSTSLHPLFEAQYKGSVKNKDDVVKKAKFAVVFENVRYPDYVSEKIFDALNVGTIPIYYGSETIEDFVPKECFINFLDFASYEELYAYIKNMDAETYQGYVDCIKNFIVRENTQPKFGMDEAVDVVLSTIFDEK